LQKVTLKDIARETGYSTNTVSRALKDKDDISESTKSHIKDVARRMGYIPNNVASSLRSGLTKTIAVILSDISNPYFSIMAKHIEIAARKYDYTIFVINSGEDYYLEEKAIYSALSKRVDGIILFPVQEDNKDIKFLKESQIPFVILGRYFEDIQTDYLITDDVKGGYLATKHLIECGRERILFLNGPSYVSCARQREKGYMQALKEKGIEVDPDLLKRVSITTGSAYSAVKEVLKSNLKFSGIFAFSDVIAWEVAYALEQSGINIPEDVGLVGYDNIQSQLYFPYEITTVDTSKEIMAYKAVEVLMRRIGNSLKDDEYHQEILDTELIIRGSSKDI
jgi:LacI family transcriptional regulator